MPQISAHLPKDFLKREGETLPEALVSLKKSVQIFLETINAVPEPDWFKPIAPNKWSKAEIADHVAKLNIVFAKVIRVAGQNPNVLIADYGWLSQEGKPVAPETLLPSQTTNKTEAIEKLKTSLEKLVLAAEAETDFNAPRMAHPFLGLVNTLELVQNASWHARHHAKQLQNK